MPDSYGVICTCGYTTLVRDYDFGSEIECANCGAELDVDESSAVPVSPRDDSAQLEGGYDRGLSESPQVVQNPSEAGLEEGAPSPFDEEMERSELRPDEYGQPPSPAPARSPFEEDEPEEEETLRSGPFTLEPAPEAEDASFQELMEAERPKEGNRHVIIETDSPLDKKTGEMCGDCGRAIRGDWDRFETADGVICYVCSNQATHGMPERLITGPERRELSEEDLLLQKEKTVEQNPPAGG